MTIAIRLLMVTTLIAVLAACSGGGSAASATPPSSADLTVDARNASFSVGAISMPAGKPFTIFFRNLDRMRHNIAIYTDDSARKAAYVGDVISDAAAVYEVPPLAPGTYLFQCDVHPSMRGTVDVPGGS